MNIPDAYKNPFFNPDVDKQTGEALGIPYQSPPLSSAHCHRLLHPQHTVHAHIRRAQRESESSLCRPL